MFVFPGQGSQFVGMGKDVYQNYHVARQVFEEVDDSLGFFLSKLILHGPENDLHLTQNTQPALMCVSMAVLAALRQELGFDFIGGRLAGHSLGEYSALCASESFSLSDTAKLLKTRGKAMQDAVPVGEGGMIAILGSQKEEVERLIKNLDCEIANDNGGNQFVISGYIQSIQNLKKMCDAESKRSVILPVSAPFHCKLMEKSTHVMEEALECTEIKKPKIPIVSNVTAELSYDSDEIKNLLIKQIVSTVRWRESIMNCVSCGIDTYIEIGPKSVLSNLIKRIYRKAQVFSIHTTQDILKFVSEFNVISQLTKA